MRCDCCPLSDPEDTCPEADGKYGINHKDGVLGCSHPWNWVNKRDIDGYNNSKGVMIEHEYCKEHRIPEIIIGDCDKCEYNDRIKCGVDFCMVPGCVKVKEGGGDG